MNIINKIKDLFKKLFKGKNMSQVNQQQNTQKPSQSNNQVKSEPLNTSKLVFATKLSSGVVLSKPKISGVAKNYLQFFTGVDSQTKFSMDDINNFFGPNTYLQVQSIAETDSTEALIQSRLESKIITAVGPFGKSVPILRNTIKTRIGKAGDSPAPQIQFMVSRNSNGKKAPLPINEWYYSLYIKLDAKLLDRLVFPTVGPGSSSWAAIAEFKTGGYNGVNGHGDYRLIVNAKKGPDGLYFTMGGDNAANGLGAVPGVDAYNISKPFWMQTTKPGIVPTGKWLKLEVYVKRPVDKNDLVTGISWAAITPLDTKQRTVIGHKVGGIQMGVADLPLGRLFLYPNYSGGNPVITHEATDLEIWDGLPFDKSILSLNNVMSDN